MYIITITSLLVGAFIQSMFAAPVAEPQHFGGFHEPPPGTYTIIIPDSSDTGSAFPSQTGTESFTGSPTGCPPMFSTVGGGSTGGGSSTLTRGNTLAGNTATDTFTGPLSVMTMSGTHTGMWMLPTDCTGGGRTGINTLNTATGTNTRNTATGTNTRNTATGTNTQNTATGTNTQNTATGTNTQNTATGISTVDTATGKNTLTATDTATQTNSASGSTTSSSSSSTTTA